MTCNQCSTSAVLEKYEKKLFSVSRKKIEEELNDESDAEESVEKEEEEDPNAGKFTNGICINVPKYFVAGDWWAKRTNTTFGNSEYERILQVLIATVKLHDRNSVLAEAAQKHFDALAQMKKECKKVNFPL